MHGSISEFEFCLVGGLEEIIVDLLVVSTTTIEKISQRNLSKNPSREFYIEDLFKHRPCKVNVNLKICLTHGDYSLRQDTKSYPKLFL